MSSSLGNTQLLVGRAGGYSSNYTADISGSLYCASGCVLGASGGYVGIGTTNPTQLLDIVSSSNPTTIRMATGSTASYILSGFIPGVVGYTGIQTRANTTTAPTTPSFVVTDSGYVGIGTTNPQSALDITGTIRASGGITPTYSSPSSIYTNANQIGYTAQSVATTITTSNNTAVTITIANPGVYILTWSLWQAGGGTGTSYIETWLTSNSALAGGSASADGRGYGSFLIYVTAGPYQGGSSNVQIITPTTANSVYYIGVSYANGYTNTNGCNIKYMYTRIA